jgi:hypothetical protein
MQKQIANAIPTWARALDRFLGVEMSERMALVMSDGQFQFLDYDGELT